MPGVYGVCRVAGVVLMVLAGGVIGCSHSQGQSKNASHIAAARDVNRDTDRAKTENTRALELIQKRKYNDAEPVLQKALNYDGMYGPAHVNLGTVYYHQGKYYQAAWEFEYAAKLMPQQPEPRNNLGLVFEATGKLDDAIREYSSALQMAPDDPEYLANAARARIERGDRDDEVRDLLSRLIAHDTRPQWVQWARAKMIQLQRSKPE